MNRAGGQYYLTLKTKKKSEEQIGEMTPAQDVKPKARPEAS